MAILKAVLYVLAVLFLVGGGLCAATAVFVPADGMGEIMALALAVMLVSFVVMKVLGKPKFNPGSPGETVLFILLFLLFGMPAIQALLFPLGFALGLNAFGPLVSLVALVAGVYFFVRRYRALAAKVVEPSSGPDSSDPPPPQA
ncbi:MAG TPA: hypothetical protein PLL19_12765 [Thiobacillaceae bacterium]|nr:hypothetical protein [Thiobacillaceae bacterium]HNF90199.1 hypothetical protein [Thiobacillaceae bacterium]HNH89116.1 hypothetical protein [Thiobacillaceae bacterium]HNI07885.1 hypothetical protein [Thiobacillaceae bacterium]